MRILRRRRKAIIKYHHDGAAKSRQLAFVAVRGAPLRVVGVLAAGWAGLASLRLRLGFSLWWHHPLPADWSL
jgi:hypothetical protein